MSHFSPLSKSFATDQYSKPRTSRSGSHFRLEAEFQGFASGKKSPFKYLLVKTATEEVRIKLKKSLRMMLFRYLVPGDWIRIVGRQKWDGDRDEMALKADEVIRITAPQASPQSLEMLHNNPGEVAASVSSLANGKLKTVDSNTGNTLANQAKMSKSKAPKILICQKSGCRKRGGTAVSQMVERSLSELGLSDQVTVKYTGCMDRCKAGPNVVFMPGKAKYTRVKPGSVSDLVVQHCSHLRS